MLRIFLGLSDKQLQINLDMVALDNAPEFTALLYTWNLTFLVHIIQYGEAQITVGHNLQMCILQLRNNQLLRTTIDFEPMRFVSTRYIFHNAHSKSRSCSASSYHSATETILRLGEGFHSIEEGVGLARQLSDWLCQHFQTPPQWTLGQNSKARQNNAEDLQLMLFDPKHAGWKALDTIFWSFWFTCTWIIRKAAVSRCLTKYLYQPTYFSLQKGGSSCYMHFKQLIDASHRRQSCLCINICRILLSGAVGRQSWQEFAAQTLGARQTLPRN